MVWSRVDLITFCTIFSKGCWAHQCECHLEHCNVHLCWRQTDRETEREREILICCLGTLQCTLCLYWTETERERERDSDLFSVSWIIHMAVIHLYWSADYWLERGAHWWFFLSLSSKSNSPCISEMQNMAYWRGWQFKSNRICCALKAKTAPGWHKSCKSNTAIPRSTPDSKVSVGVLFLLLWIWGLFFWDKLLNGEKVYKYLCLVYREIAIYDVRGLVKSWVSNRMVWQVGSWGSQVNEW